MRRKGAAIGHEKANQILSFLTVPSKLWEELIFRVTVCSQVQVADCCLVPTLFCGQSLSLGAVLFGNSAESTSLQSSNICLSWGDCIGLQDNLSLSRNASFSKLIFKTAQNPTNARSTPYLQYDELGHLRTKRSSIDRLYGGTLQTLSPWLTSVLRLQLSLWNLNAHLRFGLVIICVAVSFLVLFYIDLIVPHKARFKLLALPDLYYSHAKTFCRTAHRV